jgi:7,8-dihydropterin-6-yl-methyl-4-(beta-D-ribofuranosyl)aminobenzene 5'-phosphate synthase
MKITILMENTAPLSDLRSEHGLSIFIETRGGKVLFDAAQSDALIPNMRQLLGQSLHADAAVISHGHYDHTGALLVALDLCGNPPLYTHPGIFTRRWSIRPGRVREIGMLWSRKEIHAHTTRLHLSADPVEVVPGVFTTGQIPRQTPFEDVGGPFFLDTLGAIPDPLDDDMALVVDGRGGIVVILGCAHSGVVNTLLHVRDQFPGKAIRAVIGGMHLHAASDERMSGTVQALREIAPGMIAAGHCTGDEAVSYLADGLPFPVKPMPTGFSITM